MRFVLLALLAACTTNTGDTEAAGSSESGSSVPTGGEVNFDCDGYCTRITANCTATNAQYPNKETCLSTCAHFDVGSEADMTGNTLGCRYYHADAAADAPETHCTHAGPGGNGQCGANCEGFCAIATSACAAAWPDPAACLTTCATYSDAEPFDAGDAAGDTLACRLYHLTVATVLPTVHCPHTQPMSEPCA